MNHLEMRVVLKLILLSFFASCQTFDHETEHMDLKK